MNEVSAYDRDPPLVWQSVALFPFLNVVKNVEFGLRMRGVKPFERLEIAEFAERDVAQFSGGQRQRVALARALVTQLEILLLDEPLSAIDANLGVRMQNVPVGLQRELGIKFVYVNRSQSEAFAMADRVIIMSRGRVEQIGTPRDVYRNPTNRFVAATDSADEHLVGAQVSFVVSADRITVAAEPVSGENQLTCSFISEEFIGSIVTLHFEAADSSEFRVHIQQRQLHKLELSISASLHLAWAGANTYILPEGARKLPSLPGVVPTDE